MTKVNRKNPEKVERIYQLIEKCEENCGNSRDELVGLLNQASSMYSELQRENGINYLPKKFPDISQRMGKLVTRIMEYQS